MDRTSENILLGFGVCPVDAVQRCPLAKRPKSRQSPSPILLVRTTGWIFICTVPIWFEISLPRIVIHELIFSPDHIRYLILNMSLATWTDLRIYGRCTGVRSTLFAKQLTYIPICILYIHNSLQIRSLSAKWGERNNHKQPAVLSFMADTMFM
jgi:hypothetical protein